MTFVHVSNQNQLDGTKCTKYFDGAIFSIMGLYKSDDYTYVMQNGDILYYNFCFQIKKPIEICNNSYASIISADNQACYQLTTSETGDLEKFTLSPIDPDYPSIGLKVTVTGGSLYNYNDTSNRDVVRYELEEVIVCKSLSEDEAKQDPQPQFVVTQIQQLQNRFVIEGYSPLVCPQFQFSKIWQFMSEHQIMFSIIVIALGIVECFFGLKVLQPTLFIIGYLLGFCLLYALCAEIVDTDNIFIVWLILLISILFGALTGYIAWSLPKIGFFCLGFFFGMVIALLLNNLVLYKVGSNSQTILWVAIWMLGISFGTLSFYLWKHLIIILTSFIGAYAIVKPIGSLTDTFPNEFVISKKFQIEQMYSVPSLYYIWLIIIFALAGIGIYWQYYQFLKNKREGNIDNNNSQIQGGEGDYVDLNDFNENRNNKYKQLEREIYSGDIFTLGSAIANESTVINEKKHVQLKEIQKRKIKIQEMANQQFNPGEEEGGDVDEGIGNKSSVGKKSSQKLEQTKKNQEDEEENYKPPTQKLSGGQKLSKGQRTSDGRSSDLQEIKLSSGSNSSNKSSKEQALQNFEEALNQSSTSKPKKKKKK